jgi:hypothetical protein
MRKRAPMAARNAPAAPMVFAVAARLRYVTGP